MKRIELIEKRKERKMSLRELGETIGYSFNYLSQIENGLRNPSPELAIKLESVLGIDAGELILDKARRKEVSA